MIFYDAYIFNSVLYYSQEHNIFDIYSEHFALLATCTPYRRSRHSTP
jgi:hypothetical protein